MVKEDGNAKIEIARLEAERQSLVPHVPEALKDLGVEVGFHGIFCCMGAFYLHLLEFICHFFSRMTTLVESTFWSPAELFIFLSFHNHFK